MHQRCNGYLCRVKDRLPVAGAIAAFLNEYFSARRGTVGLAVDGALRLAQGKQQARSSLRALRMPSDVYLDPWMRGSELEEVKNKPQNPHELAAQGTSKLSFCKRDGS